MAIPAPPTRIPQRRRGLAPILAASGVGLAVAALVQPAPAKAAASCLAGSQITVSLQGDPNPYNLCVSDKITYTDVPDTPWFGDNKLAHQLADAITGNTAIGQVTLPSSGFSIDSAAATTGWSSIQNDSNSAFFLYKELANGNINSVAYNLVGGNNYSVNNGPSPDPGQLYNFVLFLPDPQHVPAPLPILGAGAAFAWSRRLRRRLRRRDQAAAVPPLSLLA